MSEERIHHEPELFPLPRHDVDRVVQKSARDFRGCFGHEDARIRLALHQERQSPSVIEVGVGKDDRIDRPVADRSKIWQRLLPFLLRMHAGIQDQPLPSRLQVITIRADLSPAGEIYELQQPEDERAGVTTAMAKLSHNPSCS